MDEAKLLETLQALKGYVDEVSERFLLEHTVTTTLALALIKAGAFNDEHVAAIEAAVRDIGGTDRFQKLGKERVEGLAELVKTHRRGTDKARDFDA